MDEVVETVRIPAKTEAAYEVRIGSGIIADILPDVRTLWPERRPFVVTDANLRRAGHLETLVGQEPCEVYVIDPPGEQSKTLEAAGSILGAMEHGRYGRDSVILALGGGTVGDIAGFAAAIFKRGVPCVQIPTTTVAQADSAIGGKTGVDSDLSKNAYGAFHHPARVYVDCAALRTLDERHYRAGLVESVKHAMIADTGYSDYIEANVDALLERDETVLRQLAAKNCAIKGRIVFEDPEENNLRRVLNFGHTLGHAVEAASGFSLLHGEAVAVGIMAACRIAERMGIASSGPGGHARAVLEQLGMALSIPASISPDSLREAMMRDKKAVGQSPRFVLLKELGAVYAPEGAYAVAVPSDVIETVIEELRAS